VLKWPPVAKACCSLLPDPGTPLVSRVPRFHRYPHTSCSGWQTALHGWGRGSGLSVVWYILRCHWQSWLFFKLFLHAIRVCRVYGCNSHGQHCCYCSILNWPLLVLLQHNLIWMHMRPKVGNWISFAAAIAQFVSLLLGYIFSKFD